MSKRTSLFLSLVFLIVGILFSSCGKDDAIKDDINPKDWDFVYYENYVDSLDAIISNKGYVALFGGIEVPISEDISSMERAIYVTKCNLETGDLDESDANLIVVDSTFVPTQIISNKGILRLSQLDNGKICCLYKLTGEEDWTEIEEIDFDITNLQYQIPSTRSLATGGVSNFTIATALQALDVVSGLKGAIQSTSLVECLSNGLGIFGNFIRNDEASVGTGLVSAGLTKSLNSGLLSILSYAGEKIADGPIKYLGPVRLAIEDVSQTSRNTCNITYTVTGLHEYGMTNSWLYFELYKGQKRIDTIYLPSKNGTVTKAINNLEPGQYGVVLHIKTKRYHWEYWTSPTVNFSVFDLGLDRYEIEDNPSYSNGTVNFKIDVYLKGSNDGLRDVQQFGYYIRYSNASTDYKQVSRLSTVFESTPLTYTLPIDFEGFNEKNYNTFKAKATGYYIGAYIQLNNGNFVTIDEQEIQGLVYEEKPSITFTSASIKGTEVTEYDEDGGIISYKTSYTFDCDIKGSFWFNTIQFQVISNNWTNYWDNQTISKDGAYTMNGNMTYGAKASMSHTCFYQMYLHNGGTKNSTNSLIIGGRPGNPSISIGGAPAYAPAKTKIPNRKAINYNEVSSFVSVQKK